jgi:hypothetical protein
MNFFIDNNISYRIAKMLAGLTDGEHIIRHITEDPRFSENTRDIIWIHTLGKDNIIWNVISGDADIIDTAVERAALIQAKLAFFCMDHNWGKAKIADQAWKIVRIWPEIVRYATNPEPTLYRVHMGRSLSVEPIGHGKRTRGGWFRDKT